MVFIVDEGHMLIPEQLEDLRMLTSAEMDSRSPAAVLLIGQPTLRRRLHQGALVAIDQRISLRVHLDGTDLSETSDYLRHHLALAGRSDTLFSDDALIVIHQASRGLPRAINNLALQSLVATFSAKKSIVDQSAAKMTGVDARVRGYTWSRIAERLGSTIPATRRRYADYARCRRQLGLFD